LTFITQALTFISKLQLESASLNASPIANLGISMCQMQGIKEPKQLWFNPYPELLKTYEKSDSDIPLHVQQTFLDLSKSGKLPSWVTSFLEIN
jgi:hypothetical protein